MPIKAIVAALRGRGYPSAVSQTAGTFVCNHVFYGLMHELRGKRGVRGGFFLVGLQREIAVGSLVFDSGRVIEVERKVVH